MERELPVPLEKAMEGRARRAVYNTRRQVTEMEVARKEAIYTYENLWVSSEERNTGTVVRVGISEHLTRIMNPIEAVRVFPKGRCVNRGYPFGSVEHGRRVVLLKSPVSGSILEVNDGVLKNPRLVSDDPYGKGWIAMLKPTS